MTMTEPLANRCVILSERPRGVPEMRHFSMREMPVRDLSEGEILVRNRFWSVDPAMRGWANDAPNYLPPVAIGEVMRSLAVGEVAASRHPGYAEGDAVTGMFGWQRYAAVDASAVDRKISETDLPLSYALGILGLNGVTAYFGLLDICRPEAGDTVVVSTAAGAVGSAVGQIAKLEGCRAVGIAGGSEKVRLYREVYGYDAAIDYKAGDLDAALADACQDGIDCYFDNTCGLVSDAVMRRLAHGARIAICGTAAVTDWDPQPQGPRVHRQLLVARARMQGFLSFDFKDRYGEAIDRLAGWLRAGEIATREHVLEGAEAAPDAIAMLYRGENEGKLLIEVD